MKSIKFIFTTALSILLSFSIQAQEAFTVSTFHNLSVYWSPMDGAIDKKVWVEYKVAGTTAWKDALPMKYNPIPNVGENPIIGGRYDKADYRGSIVNLQPNTNYDIRLKLENSSSETEIQAKTWNEEFPIGQTIKPGNLTTGYNVPSSGTANGYLLIDGTGSTIDIQDNSNQCIFIGDREYVIIRGYTLKNGGKYGIRIDESSHIVIENCDISQWGEEDVAGTGFGVGYQSGIYAASNDAAHCVIQRNRIHHPKWDTNSWAELHDPASDPNNNSNYHPDGPQGISLGRNSIGNHVIRYNEIWSDDEHYFNDILGMWENASYSGFPGADSDIYGNYFANCFDDGIESEGSNTNVRIWNNYIEEVFLGIGNAATSIGPLYVWKNVTGRAYSHPNSVYGNYGGFLKMGYANSLDWMTGHMYIFNNTILQPNDHGTGGLGTSDGDNRYIRHCETRNNILHVRSSTGNSISDRSNPNHNIDNDFDYDLMNKSYPEGHEMNGLSGTPIYENLSFDFGSKTGNFILNSTSLGYDSGEIIPNFTDNYVGAAPDMGAHEHGYEPKVYGIHATQGEMPTAIDNPDLATQAIYPNPIRDSFYFDGKGTINVLQIFSLSGVKLKTIQNIGQGQMVDVSDLSAGVYILEIATNDGKEWLKMVVE